MRIMLDVEGVDDASGNPLGALLLAAVQVAKDRGEDYTTLYAGLTDVLKRADVGLPDVIEIELKADGYVQVASRMKNDLPDNPNDWK